MFALPSASRLLRSPRARTLLVACVLGGAIGQSGQVVRLNGPMVRDTVGIIPRATLLADASRVVYSGDLAADDVFELWSAPVTTGTPVRLNAALVQNGDVLDFQVAPASDRIVYRADQRVNTVDELFSVPADHRRPAVRISGTLVSGGDVRKYAISSDATRVAYVADQSTDGVDELYATLIDGFAQAVKVNGPMASDGDVIDFQFGPDARSLVYLADQDGGEIFELYAVDEHFTRVKLNAPLVPGGDVGLEEFGRAFEISSDGTRVVYRADQLANDRAELFSVPLDAHAPPVRLNADLVPGGEVASFALDPTAQRVVYVADQDTASVLELYSVPLDGSAPPVKLNAPLPTDADVANSSARPAFRIAPDGAHVAFTVHVAADRQELYTAPIDGSAAAVWIDPGASVTYVRDVLFRSDGGAVVFRTWGVAVSGAPLFVAPIDGSMPPLELSAPFPSGSHVFDFAFALVPGSDRVLYLGDQEFPGVQELFGVPCDGSTVPVRINAPLVVNGDVQEFQTSADGSLVLYRADQGIDEVVEAFGAPPDGSAPARKLHPDLPLGPTTGDVYAFEITPDGARALYTADQEENGRYDVFTSPLDGSTPPVALSEFPAGGGWYRASFQLAPDGRHAVVLRHSALGDELFASPADGSTSPTFLAAADFSDWALDFAISPDSGWVVYRQSSAQGPMSLHAVPLDGTSSPVLLSGAGVTDYAIDPTSRRIVYRSGALFSVPLDGSAAPVQLAPVGAAEFDFAPDGATVAFRSDQDAFQVYALYRVAIDGSAAPVQLSAQLPWPGVLLPLQITADSMRVVYPQESGQSPSLASARLDATEAPRILATLDYAPTDVQLAGDVAVYIATAPGNFASRLYSVPVEGGTPPLDLSGPPPQGTHVDAFELAPDGSRAVYGALGALFSVPLDGSAAPVPLFAASPTVAAFDFEVSADSRSVVFVGTLRIPTVRELFRSPLDASAAPVRLSSDLVYDTASSHGNVTEFRLAARGRSVVYLADQQQDEVFELYGRREVGALAKVPPPTASPSRTIP